MHVLIYNLKLKHLQLIFIRNVQIKIYLSIHLHKIMDYLKIKLRKEYKQIQNIEV